MEGVIDPPQLISRIINYFGNFYSGIQAEMIFF